MTSSQAGPPSGSSTPATPDAGPSGAADVDWEGLREAGRQLYGYYRNPFTDDPAVRDPAHPNRRTVANTAPVVHGGKLFALKEMVEA